MIRQKEGFNGERQLVLPSLVVNLEENDPLVQTLYVTALGFYPEALHHFIERERGVDQYLLIYCVSGQGWYKVRGKSFKVEPNQYFILPINEYHSYGAAKGDPWTIYWIHFKGTCAEIYAQGSLEPTNISPTADSRIFLRNNIFEELFNTLQHGYDIECLRYASCLLHHYLGSIRYLQQYREANSDKESQNVVAACQHWLKENIERRITIDELSHYAGYSQSHLSKIFKKMTGQSPIAYFNDLKIRKACELLDNSNMKINQICHQVGIEDSYYFSRLFSQHMHISPQNYRKRGESKQ
jgi:AraC family transcriptional regulator of arabinose operon